MLGVKDVFARDDTFLFGVVEEFLEEDWRSIFGIQNILVLEDEF